MHENTTDDLSDLTSFPPVKNHPKGLSHCASSPDFRRTLEVVEEQHDDEENDYDNFSVENDTTETSSCASATSRISFRDALLLTPPPKEAPPAEVISSAPRPRMSQPRFVVAPIKRCTKSTGDLLKIAEDDDEDWDGAFLGQKARGARSRANGQKLRPDERQRKLHSISKRNQQRGG